MKAEKGFNNPNQLHLPFQEPGEKEAVAAKYGIINEGLKRLEKRSDGWYMDGKPIEAWKEDEDRLYEKDSKNWWQN